MSRTRRGTSAALAALALALTVPAMAAAATKPGATTLGASKVTITTATLAGQVNPHGAPTVFGMLQEVLGSLFQHEDFVRICESHEGPIQVLTTANLPLCWLEYMAAGTCRMGLAQEPGPPTTCVESGDMMPETYTAWWQRSQL